MPETPSYSFTIEGSTLQATLDRKTWTRVARCLVGDKRSSDLYRRVARSMADTPDGLVCVAFEPIDMIQMIFALEWGGA